MTAILKNTRNALLAALAAFLMNAPLHAATASDASIEELLVLARAELVLEAMLKSMEDGMRRSIAAAPANPPRNSEQQRLVDELPGKFGQLMRAELNWATLREVSVASYRETFDQAEIDGLIAFYKSPAGRSFIAKMPLVMQRSNALMQERMVQVMPRVQAALAQLRAEIDAAK